MREYGPTSRRQWLAACGGATAGLTGLAGCIGDGSDDEGNTSTEDDEGNTSTEDSDGENAEETDDEDVPEDEEQLQGWPMYGTDHHASGHHPDAGGPEAGGQVRWTVDEEDDRMVAFNGSPVGLDGTVYVGGSDGILRGVDVSSGDVVTELSLDGRIQNAPIVREDRLYVSTRTAMVAVDRSEETVLWSDEPDDGVVAQPTLRGDELYAPIHRGSRPRIARWDVDSGERETLFTASGEEFVDPGDQYGQETASEALALSGAHVFVGLLNRVVAIDVESGEASWRSENDADAPMVVANPATDGDAVYATWGRFEDEDEPGCVALDADSGDERWQFRPDVEGLPFSPTVADGSVYVQSQGEGRRDGTIWKLDADDGAEQWSASGGAGKPVVAGGTVYTRGRDGCYALDADDGQRRWEADISNHYSVGPPAPAIHDGVVVFVEEYGSFSAIEEP